MDKYYGNVCELDIIFSFTKAYYILDEILLAGELQESSKKNVLRCIGQQDSLEDMEVRSFRSEHVEHCHLVPPHGAAGPFLYQPLMRFHLRSRTRSRKSCNGRPVAPDRGSSLSRIASQNIDDKWSNSNIHLSIPQPT